MLQRDSGWTDRKTRQADEAGRMDSKIKEYLQRNKDEAIQTLKSLISINSVQSDPVTAPDG